jgi:ABC-type transport system involved in multi-copper enzyme maturation permease subunit
VSTFAALARDALRDAARRRGLVAAAVASAIAALAIERCGHCEAAVSIQGEALSAQAGELAVIGAIASLALVALWTYAVAALLAADGIAAALEDGVVEAVLARPVSRDVLVLARLAGAWSGAFALGTALFALAVGLAASRPGVTLAPALAALLWTGVSAWTVAALAMCVSLSLPRAATLLLFGALGAGVVGIETAGLFGARMGGIAGAIAACGPAWLAAPVSALAPWLSAAQLPGPPTWPNARALLWAAAATCALVARFRRLELPR